MAPLRIDDIIGHAAIKQRLPSLKPGKSYLFTGPKGVGKASLAKAFAISLIGRPDHPDLLTFSPEGKAQLHTAEAMRTCKKEAQRAPHLAKQLIILIDDAEKMQEASSNALLKVLEEPLETTLFLLIAHRKEQVLPTILSRTEELRFSHVPFAERSGPLSQISSFHWTLASGSVGKARRFAEKGLPGYLVATLHHLELKTPLSDQVYKTIEEDPEAVETLFQLIGLWYRDLEVLHLGGKKIILEEKQSALLEALERGQNRPLSLVSQLLIEAKTAFERNLSSKHIFENLWIKLEHASLCHTTRC